MVISIDIGTSYSSACLLTPEGKAEPVETTTGISIYGGKYSLPSAVFIDEDGKVLVGQAAMNSRKKMPQNFRSEFKENLGQDIPVVLGGRKFLPEDLYTELFLHMKKCAEKQGMEEVEKAYITYPASFGKTKRERITQAARKAGLFDTELVDEPTAAAMCYGEKGKVKDRDVLLVYDFGGGTFDAAVLKYENGKYEPLAPAEGAEHCGGIDIDRMVYWDMHGRIAPELLQPLAANKLNRLRFESNLAELAVKIKHHLSAAEYAYEDIVVGYDVIEYRLSRDGLEKMAAGLVAQTIDCCRSILGSAGIAVSDLDGILMVGGTSRMPLVQRMVREFAGGVAVHTDVDLDLAVVQGTLYAEKGNKDAENADDFFVEKREGNKEEERNDIGFPIGLGPKGNTQEDIIEWYQKNIASLIINANAHNNCMIAVKADGRVVSKCTNLFQEWKDIVSVVSGSFSKQYSNWTVGLKRDGTVVTVGGDGENGQNIFKENGIENWKNIVSIISTGSGIIGLKGDGTIVSLGVDKYKYEIIRHWDNVMSVACYQIWKQFNKEERIVGLRKDGTALATGYNSYGECDVGHWSNIEAIACGDFHTVGLRKDGTVLACGSNKSFQNSVKNWSNLKSIACGSKYTVGLRKDGTVLITGSIPYGVYDIGNWSGIESIICMDKLIFGFRKDGHVLCTGGDENQRNLFRDWKNIIAVRCLQNGNIIGITSDGWLLCSNSHTGVMENSGLKLF